MGEAVEQSRCSFGITEDCGPFTDVGVGGDDGPCALVKLAEQMEQQCATWCAERPVSGFVEDQ